MKFARLVIPTVLRCNFMLLTGMADTIFAARFNDAAKLAGVGLGNTTLNIFGLSIIMGMNGALETLVS